MSWEVIACGVGGGLLVVVLRPWRFWWARRHCPQCKNTLPRWNLFGWKEDWTCKHCGCQIGE